MTEKRFQWVFIKDNELEFQDNGIVKRFENHRLEEFLNELNDENQSIKKHIEELYDIVKVDVDNEIEVYPKTLMEYILNILKIIGDVE